MNCGRKFAARIESNAPRFTRSTLQKIATTMYLRYFFLEPADPTKAGLPSTSAGASGYKISFTEFGFFAFFVLSGVRSAPTEMIGKHCDLASDVDSF